MYGIGGKVEEKKTDIVNEYLKKAKRVDGRLREELKCNDRFSMSVQASRTHYSSPRIDDAEHYDMVEIGYPSKRETLLLKYAGDKKNPTGTVYSRVPVEVVAKVIKKHRGISRSQRKRIGLEG
jgi:hypothetical protein